MWGPLRTLTLPPLMGRRGDKSSRHKLQKDSASSTATRPWEGRSLTLLFVLDTLQLPYDSNGCFRPRRGRGSCKRSFCHGHIERSVLGWGLGDQQAWAAGGRAVWQAEIRLHVPIPVEASSKTFLSSPRPTVALCKHTHTPQTWLYSWQVRIKRSSDHNH